MTNGQNKTPHKTSNSRASIEQRLSRELLRPLIAHEVRPVSENGAVGRGRKNSFDNVKAMPGGNSTEYLLGRMGQAR